MNNETETTRIDRRKRHAHDPTTPITVNMSISLLQRLDAEVERRGGARSAWIAIAVRELLAHQADEAESDG